jgi:hypothetical protein
MLVYEAALGEVGALNSLLLKEGNLPWDLFALAKPASQKQQNILRNLIFENIKRGASLQAAKSHKGSTKAFDEMIDSIIRDGIERGEPLYL